MAEPYRTQTTRNETGLLTPFIAELRGGSSDARSTKDSLSTVTASGNHHGLVMQNHGNFPGGDAQHSTPTEEPMRTIVPSGKQTLITGGVPNIDDCSFRMLSPNEISRAMAFPIEYQMLGTKRDQVRLAGNAVTPPAARDLVAACAESLGVAA